MKTIMLLIVSVGFWLVLVSPTACAQCYPSDEAIRYLAAAKPLSSPFDEIEAAPFRQSRSANLAIHYLAANKPMDAPNLEVALLEGRKQKAAALVLKAQIQALDAAKECKSPSAVTVLILYLNYSRDGKFELGRTDNDDDPKNTVRIKEKWPAFAAITSIPGTGKPLAEYVLNTDNPLCRRITAFQVLRYVDQNRFKATATAFNHDIAATASASTNSYVKAIKDENLPFDGLYSVSPL